MCGRTRPHLGPTTSCAYLRLAVRGTLITLRSAMREFSTSSGVSAKRTHTRYPQTQAKGVRVSVRTILFFQRRVHFLALYPYQGVETIPSLRDYS